MQKYFHQNSETDLHKAGNLPRESLVLLDPQHVHGSVEHFFHFMYGFLLPLCAYLSRSSESSRYYIVRSCGPMDHLLRGLMLPRLLLLPKKECHAFSEKVRTITLPGFDSRPLFTENLPAMIAAKEFVLERYQSGSYLEGESARIERLLAVPEGERIVFIDRGAPPAFYNSSAAEVKTAANQRRSIPNSADLVERLSELFPECIDECLEHSSLRFQIELFMNADIVIAQHGAALGNLLWMKKGRAVVEIRPPLLSLNWHFLIANTVYFRTLFKSLAKVSDLHYFRVRQANNFARLNPRTLTGAVLRAKNCIA